MGGIFVNKEERTILVLLKVTDDIPLTLDDLCILDINFNDLQTLLNRLVSDQLVMVVNPQCNDRMQRKYLLGLKGRRYFEDCAKKAEELKRAKSSKSSKTFWVFK